MNENGPVLIVGLGNPGERYANTRHNVGFMAVDALAAEAGAVWKKEKNSLVAKAAGIIFAKPQTFMNLSGSAVQALITFYKIPMEKLTVIHDDMDLRLGDVRQKIGGGSGGHNGIKSIDAALGNDYNRIRIGVGRPPKFVAEQDDVKNFEHPAGAMAKTDENRQVYMDSSDWVLGKFLAEEMKAIDKVIENIKKQLL